MSEDLALAYALCDAITSTHSKSFYFSTSFLPAEKRRAIRAFYAFCRVTDDMVDATEKPDPEQLQQWRLAARRAPRDQIHPVLLAWSTERDRFQVPQQYVEELIDGCEMDLTKTRYATWQELERYCYCVASTVGLASMHIIGLRHEETPEVAIERATKLGLALQLTNILRDVSEDLARGRIYLPEEDLDKFDYTEEDLRLATNDDRFKHLMRFEMNRADKLYDEGLKGIGYLNWDGRLAVGAAAMLYRGILAKIHINDYDVFNHRAYLTQSEKVRQMPGIAYKVMRKKS